VAAFEKSSGVKIPMILTDRRPGDVAQVLAIPDKANKELGWFAKYNIEDMCRDSWRWT
jgi:UDP-glucose 4-epimerase